MILPQREYCHLRRRSDRRINGPHRRVADVVAEALSDARGPPLKLIARPLEAVVAMAEAARRQRRPARVVLRVRRREHHRGRPSVLEGDTLERRETRRAEMLDDLHYRRGVEAGEPAVAVYQRTVNQLDALPLLRRKAIESEPVRRHLERAPGHVHADDALEGAVGEEELEQSAFAAAEVHDRACASSAEGADHRAETLLVEAQRSLERALLGVASRASVVLLVRRFLGDQPRNRVAHERMTVLEVATGDRFSLGVRREPSLAMTDELLDFVVAHPVVLLVVEHGDEHVQMRQQLGEPLFGGEREGVIPTGAPLGHRRIERMRRSRYRVAERLEQLPEEALALAAGYGGQPRRERDRRGREVGAFLAASRHRAPEDVGDGDAQEGRRDIRAVVDVLHEQAALTLRPAAAAHEAYRIDVEQERRRAAVGGCFRVEHVRAAERQLKALRAGGVLVEEVTEIGGRAVSCRDGEEHGRAKLRDGEAPPRK